MTIYEVKLTRTVQQEYKAQIRANSEEEAADIALADAPGDVLTWDVDVQEHVPANQYVEAGAIAFED